MHEEVGTTVDGDLVINIGPQHPSTHGVLHLITTLRGETIMKIEPHLGYIHRSIEKMCESLTYRQFLYVTSKMDYCHRISIITVAHWSWRKDCSLKFLRARR
jgi:NADH-quinone oxidoreductase subunit D/NADH-quinone oxidoreductase subunit C/D